MTLITRSPSILVVGPAWVGDMLMAQSLFQVLKLEQVGVLIDVLAPTWSAGLLAHIPEVRHVIAHDIAHGQIAWKTRYRLGQELAKHGYQQAIVLPNSWKSALIPFWAKIPRRTGYIGEFRYGLLNDIRHLKKNVLPKTVDQFIALGLPKDDTRQGKLTLYPRLSPGNADHILHRLNIPHIPEKPLLALCPGAEYGPAKRWPPEYFAQVAREKIEKGWQVWIFGSNTKKEIEIGNRIQALAGESCLNLCGKTQLGEAIDLLALARVIVSNDSGLMHIAAALGKPLIALYGSSSPDMTPPLTNKAHILYSRLPCSPCFARSCPLGHLQCLRALTPQQVLDIIELRDAQLYP